jgi:NTE family protein
MKKFALFLSFSFILSFTANAQKVGLVLSGGGAPGIAHIGMIKALEENNIPIDYIAGTSIGAIVGGMYAMGMTPDEMIGILKSSDFRNWMKGEISPTERYYFWKNDPKPTLAELKIHFDKSGSIKMKLLPSSYVSSAPMNFAFIPLFARANALKDGKFDNLLVPFRCVASDVYNKQAVVFREGNLGNAIRTSMTFPFMFKPVSTDSTLLFDGGIYNNFPAGVMQKEFQPDYIIGSVVAYNTPKATDDDLLMQLQNMIITRTDYSLPTANGLLLKFDLAKVDVFDFSKVDELVKVGYDSVMKHLDEIKSQVERRVSKQELSLRRAAFKAQLPAFKFKEMDVKGVDSLQQIVIKRNFKTQHVEFGLEELKRAYFNLISDERMEEVFPQTAFNAATGQFDLKLNVKNADKWKVQLGGNISSGNCDQAFVGLTYQNYEKLGFTASIDGQLGKFYNGASVSSRLDMPSKQLWFLKANVATHQFSYAADKFPALNQNETYGKLAIGFPLTMKGRLELGMGYGFMSDNYNPENSSESKIIDQLQLGSLFLKAESNTLNNSMYPTNGHNYRISAQFLNGAYTQPANRTDSWFQYRIFSDQYFQISRRFTLGTYAELTVSTQGLLPDYSAAIIQAPSFQPTLFSKAIFDEAYRANRFGAFGLKPVYGLSDQMQLRNETYWFLPYQSILRAADNSAYYSQPFSTSHWLSETALVYDFKVATASLFAFYNSASASHWHIGFNIGVLLFQPKFKE